MWTEAFDDLNEAIRESADEREMLTVDQRLKVAEIKALLSIGQELSLIQDQGINPEWSQRTESPWSTAPRPQLLLPSA